MPLEVHIQAFPGKYYCPRMATMNKPAFQAIKQYSPSQPVLIFVSSRRQTRLTAMDLLAHLASENNPKQWLRMKDSVSIRNFDDQRSPLSIHRNIIVASENEQNSGYYQGREFKGCIRIWYWTSSRGIARK